VVIRPPDIVVGGLRLYRDSSNSFFLRQLPYELAERNLTKTGHVLGSDCDLKVYVRNLEYLSFPYKSGTQNHLFSTTSQLNGNFNGLYLRKETQYRQSGTCVGNYNGSPISPRNVMNFGPHKASNWTAIFTHPT